MSLIKKPLFIVSALAVIGLATGGYFYFKHSQTGQPDIIVVKKGDITQEVSVTGQIKPIESVDLAFVKSGKVIKVNAETGDKVSSGEILVALDSRTLAADMLQAQGDWEAQQAKLDELKKGTRPEEIQIEEVKVVNAQTALEDARKGLMDKLQDAYTKAEDAVRNKVDQFFSNPRSSNPQINFPLFDSQLALDIQFGRVSAENTLVSWKASLDGLATSSDFLFYVNTANNNLSQIKSFLDKVALAINSVKSSSVLAQATIDGYRSDVSTGRANINTAITNLSTAWQNLRAAQSDLTLEQNQLVLEKAGTVPEQIAAQEAQVKQAQAKVESTQAQINDMILISPLSGVVTKQDAKVGEIVSTGVPVVSIISNNQFEIDAQVPETDIGKISVGNSVNMTFDAFPGEIFKGKVFYIDPAQTIDQGVVDYKIKVSFDTVDPRMKSGLTVNLTVQTRTDKNVLIVPQYAVLQNNQGTFVQKLVKGVATNTPVTLGIQDQNGNVEILSGVSEGERVLNIGLKP